MSVLTANELVLQAPAKLNLFLKVLGKRSDGYHEIETVMQAIDLYDTLKIIPREDGQFSLRVKSAVPIPNGNEALREQIPTDHTNLVLRAARLLQEQTGCSLGADLFLLKRIPSQAGLGGGSSDAGSALQGLNQLWNLNLAAEELGQIAAKLGSDIPFFTTSAGLAICTGRGETLQSERGRSFFVVVVKPHSGLSTAEVYRHCAVSTFPYSGKDVINALRAGAFSRLRLRMHNSLEEPARLLNPEVDHVLRVMQQQPFLSCLMSGSGSACYGLCHSRKHALQLAEKLAGMISGRVFVARSRV